MNRTTSVTLVNGLFDDGIGSGNDDRRRSGERPDGDLRNWAWRKFAEIYIPYMKECARRMGPASIVDDVPQEVILRLLKSKKPPVLTPNSRTGSFRRYLTTIVRRVIADIYPTTTAMLEDSMHPAIEDDTFEMWDGIWKTNLLIRGMDRLRDRVNAVNYDAYTLIVVHGMKTSQVIRRMQNTYQVAYTPNDIYQLKSRLTRYLVEEVRKLEHEIGDGICVEESDVGAIAPTIARSGETRVVEETDASLVAWLEAVKKILGDHSIRESAANQVFVRDDNGHRWHSLPTCDNVRMGADQANELVLADSFISACHCVLTCKDGTCRIVDSNSTNGTLVNHQKTSTKVLNDGDVIQVGGASLIYFAGSCKDTEAV